MKVTRLKKGYRINLSDIEFQLYVRLIDAGMADMHEPNLNDPVERLFDRINGTQKISDWFEIADDRRVT